MPEQATELEKPAQPAEADRSGDQQSPFIWANNPSQLWNKPQPSDAPAGSVELPTLHLGDDRLNVYDSYSVSSDVARLYIKNRPAIVRINTLDPKDNAGYETSAGSGEIVDPSGIIATGYHVVKNATAIRVQTADGKIYEANILATDVAKDEALLQIKSSDPFGQFPTVKLAADSSQASKHEQLLGLGFPKNQPAMHVSLLQADYDVPLSSLKVRGGLLMGEDKDRTLIKTDGPVDNGNSGGPVFDLKSGEQIGIVNLNDEKNGNAYLTPVEDLQSFLAQTKARYGIGATGAAPAAAPFQPFARAQAQPLLQQPLQFSPYSGMQSLDRVLSSGGR